MNKKKVVKRAIKQEGGFIMDVDVKTAFDSINDKLDQLVNAIPKVLTSKQAAAQAGFGDGSAPVVPVAPADKSYAVPMAQYGGEKKLATMLRQRTAGYPESSPGIVGTWDSFPWVIDFKKDYPQLF